MVAEAAAGLLFVVSSLLVGLTLYVERRWHAAHNRRGPYQLT
jgi:hypothetical protein